MPKHKARIEYAVLYAYLGEDEQEELRRYAIHARVLDGEVEVPKNDNRMSAPAVSSVKVNE